MSYQHQIKNLGITQVRIGIPKDEGGTYFLNVSQGKTLEGHIGYRYEDRMILDEPTFHQLHKAQMDSDFPTIRKIFDSCIDLTDPKDIEQQKIIHRLLFI